MLDLTKHWIQHFQNVVTHRTHASVGFNSLDLRVYLSMNLLYKTKIQELETSLFLVHSPSYFQVRQFDTKTVNQLPP